MMMFTGDKLLMLSSEAFQGASERVGELGEKMYYKVSVV
jgi:hypothetical protein